MTSLRMGQVIGYGTGATNIQDDVDDDDCEKAAKEIAQAASRAAYEAAKGLAHR